jgi:hypothetical protein
MTVITTSQDQTTVANGTSNSRATQKTNNLNFSDAFWGRYGLAGNTGQALGRLNEKVLDSAFASQFDLTSMRGVDVIELAQKLVTAARLTQDDGNLLGFNFGSLGYSSSSLFQSSPLSVIANSFGFGDSGVVGFGSAFMGFGGQDNSYNMISEYQNQIKYLTDNDADPKAINGAKRVLAQLYQLNAERALYASLRPNDDDDRYGGGTANNNPFALLSSPLLFGQETQGDYQDQISKLAARGAFSNLTPF